MDRIGNLTRLTCTLLYVMTTHAYIYTVACTLNSRLLSGHLGVVAGTLPGFRFPICYGSVGVQLTRLRALCQGILTSECVWKNLNAIVLQVTCTMKQSSRVFFLFACLKRCFRLSLSIRNKKKRTVRAVLMGTKSCTKILNFSTRFSCENLAVEDFVTLLMGKKSC